MRILVIEDDSDMRALMVEALSRDGHVVEDASDGVEGLQCAREHTPDLILLDLVMPTMDGWTFLEEQRRDARLASVPVVLVSGCPEEQVEGLDAEAYLSKAYDLDEVRAFVERWGATQGPLPGRSPAAPQPRRARPSASGAARTLGRCARRARYSLSPGQRPGSSPAGRIQFTSVSR